MSSIAESDIEEAALDWLAELGYNVLHGPDIAPEAPDAERSTYSKVVLERRFRDAAARLNPNIPAEAQEDAIRKVLHPDSPALDQNNRAFHLMLVDGIEVEARQPDGDTTDRLRLLPAAQEHILRQRDGKTRLLKTVAELSKAFALAVPHEQTTEIRDDVGFFQTVRSVLAKPTATEEAQSEATEQAIRQLVSRAVVSEGVIDIFAAAGLERPDVSILSDEFLVEVRDLPHKNVAVELLERLLNDEIRTHSRKNVVQGRSFAEMLERSIRTYQNQTVEAAQVVEELIEIAKEIRQARERGEELGLSPDELAFYDALEVNDSAVEVLGNETLRTIAVELVETVRRNVSIDWTLREGVRARLRVMVKRVLRRHGYPPDRQERATATVLEQAEALCMDWAA